MDSRWFKSVTREDQEAKKKELLSYRNAFDALREMLEEELEDYAPDYDIPSWSHKQADRNGANRKLRSILKLITIKE